MGLDCQLEVNGIKDIQQIDLIKTNKQGFEYERIDEKSNQPSVVIAKPLPECKLVTYCSTRFRVIYKEESI